VDAPARANWTASWPVEMPPHPIRGIEEGRLERRVRRAVRERGRRGGPERPPCWVALARVEWIGQRVIGMGDAMHTVM
jgi:hypothetical protein